MAWEILSFVYTCLKSKLTVSTLPYTLLCFRERLTSSGFRNLELEVIPLVQTFGHMEWILKYEEFRKYRESDSFPQVLNQLSIFF